MGDDGMTLREFTLQLWYSQNIIVIERRKFDCRDSIELIKCKALMVGNNYNLRSSAYDEINHMIVKSYGVMDNNLIIEVE